MYNVYTVYTVCHFHALYRVFRMSVDFLPMVHADFKLHRANRRRYQAANIFYYLCPQRGASEFPSSTTEARHPRLKCHLLRLQLHSHRPGLGLTTKSEPPESAPASPLLFVATALVSRR